jgi:restriction system protein
MPDVYCVRAEFGTYTKQFLDGGYAAIGWLPEVDLSKIRSKEELYPLYKEAYPEDTSNVVIGQQVGQIARFLLDIKAGDFVITPPTNTEVINYGIVERDPNYFYFEGQDGCPYPHRKRIKWNHGSVRRSDFSVPFQNTIRSGLTVYNISQADHFFEVVGHNDLIKRSRKEVYDPYKAVIDQLLELNPTEFEILITHLLAALGFEGSEHTGKTGDGGVDATGELNVANLAKVKIYVQVKRYKLGSKINANTVKALRQSIPSGGQGAFITTADFQNSANDVALEVGFPRIGLVNGRQLVDLLVEYWSDIPDDFQEKLGLKLGLVRS